MLISVFTMYRLKDKYLVSPEGKPVGVVPEHMDNSTSFLRKPWSPGGIGVILLLCASAMGLLYVHAREIFDITWLLLASLVALLYVIFSDKSLTKLETKRIIAIFVVSFFVVFFWSAYEQAGASLSFFAAEQTNLHIDLLNYNVPPSWFQSVPSAFVVIFAPVFAWLWIWLGKKKCRAHIADENGDRPFFTFRWICMDCPRC